MENPRNTPRLETPRLILRRFVPEDAPALWELLRDREVNRFLPWFPVETLAEAEKFLRERFLEERRLSAASRAAAEGCGDPCLGALFQELAAGAEDRARAVWEVVEAL